MTTAIASFIKRYFFIQQAQARQVRAGLLSGISLFLDPRSGLQREWGLAERELHRWFRKLSRGIATAVDLGSAEGDYTLFYLTKTSAENVLAFDPQPHCFEELQRNLGLNGLLKDSRLKIVTKLVGSAANEGECSLDDFLPEIRTPVLIKMDVERNEYPILLGCPQLLAKTGVRWIIEIHTPELDVQCREILEKNGFKVKSVGPAWWRRFFPEQRGEYVSWMVAWK